MSEYRIVKITTENGLGEKEEKYLIKRKLLVFWIPVYYECHCYTHTNWNESPTHGALTIRRNYSFSNKERAKEILLILEKPRYIKYNGSTIKRVFNDNGMKEIFINISNYRWWGYDRCFDFSDSLEELYRRIDKNTLKVTKIVV